MRIILFFLWFSLTACSNILPGLQNPQVDATKQLYFSEQAHIQPTLIPITPALIHTAHMSDFTYRIAPADVLMIKVWRHPEFSAFINETNTVTTLPATQGAAGADGYLVNRQGDIYFPLLGRVNVANKTIDEAREILTARLKYFIKNPNLHIRIVDYRARKVYVVGEVKKPGFIPINDQPLSITDAIVYSGGLDPTAADPSHIYVIRGDIYHPQIYWLNAKTADDLLLAAHFNLQPRDILYISSAPATRWNRVINQLLPSVQTIWYTKAIVNN